MHCLQLNMSPVLQSECYLLYLYYGHSSAGTAFLQEGRLSPAVSHRLLLPPSGT